MTDWGLKDGERLDDLVRDGMRIIQRSDQFCFSVDSVLLAHYPKLKKRECIADLGTGTGVIPLLLSTQGGNSITGFEINPIMADIARRNVLGNGKESCIHIVEGDYRKLKKRYPSGTFSLVVANPPYREVGSGRMNENPSIAGAGYEVNASLSDVFQTAQYLLSYGGRLVMVHRADRFVDLANIGRAYHMEIKRARFVHVKQGEPAVRVLAEWKYGGQPEIIVDPPLFLHSVDGKYTNEVLEIYGKNGNE